MKGKRAKFQAGGFQSRKKLRQLERKEKRKQKKMKKSRFVANPIKKNETKNDYNKFKKLSENKRKQKQINNNSSKQLENTNSVHEESSFKVVQSSSLQDRMARLQAFVNKESNCNGNDNLSKTKKKEKLVKQQSTNNNETLIKDKVKRKALLQDCKEDNKEINRLSKLLGIRKSQKKKTVHSMFDEFDLNMLLQDVDEHTLQHSHYYQDNDHFDDLNNDLNNVMVKEKQKQVKLKKKDLLCDESNDEFDSDNADEFYSDDDEFVDDIDDNESEISMSSNEQLNDDPVIKSRKRKRVQFNDDIQVKIITKRIKCHDNNTAHLSEPKRSILKQSKILGQPINGNSEDNEGIVDSDDDIADSDNEGSCFVDDDNEGSDLGAEDTEEQDAESCPTDYTEDIYGRLIDKDGNVQCNEEQHKQQGGKYVPPALRKLMQLDSNDEKKKEKLRNLSRSLKGLLNRLAEENMAGICSQIESYYVNHSRNDMNDTMTELISNSLIMQTLTPERLLQEYALMVAIISTNVGVEVGAHILTKFVERWNDLMESNEVIDQENKELDNIALFIANLYNFKVVASSLIYDIINKHIETFMEKDIDIILHIIRSVGFTLRKDDPLALKSVILSIQTKAASNIQKESDCYSRVQFMMEILLAIRNNNMSKVPDYDPTHVEHLKKMLKGITHKGKQCSELKITLQDLLNSKETGRWWLVGSAWSGGLIENKNLNSNKPTAEATVNVTKQTSKFSEKFKKYAAKLHLSRPPRINILFAMTEGSHDVNDAFEKLLQLSLPPQQEREIFNILLLCCIKGKLYNSFYAHLAEKFCTFNKKYVRLMLHTLWDKHSEITNMKPNDIGNLSQFVSFLICEECINLSVLKTLSFLESGALVISFVRQVLLSILLHPSGETVVRNIFAQLLLTPKLNVLRQSLRIFIIKYLKPEDQNSPNYSLLSKRIKVVIDTLEKCSVKL